jgi:hypothetical protein
MQWKFVLSRAGAEARGLSDSDIASVFDMALASAQPAGAGPCCPRCGNEPNDSDSKLFREESADTPEQVKGRVVVMCLCKTAYWYDAVHKIDAHQPIGEARVSAASTSRRVAPVPVPSSTPDRIMDSNDVVLRNRSRWHPAYYDTPPSPAPWIWAEVEAAKRAGGPSS